MSISPGTQIGRYKIRSAIGKGGMGEVFLAHDTILERDVAIKFLTKESSADAERLRRFIREAKAASALNHPNIITIYDVGEGDGRHFFATEFIEGSTLRDQLRKTSLSLFSILNLARQVAEALVAAHAAGIIHRDIKPENIMIRTDGYVKVLDFGLAKLKERVDSQIGIGAELPTRALIKTEPGVVMGTSTYMSPEQARGLEVDERTDIWSLGVVMYEMLARRVPFDGKTTSDVIAAILTKEPDSILEYRPDTPAEIYSIVEKSLCKDADERYASVRDLLSEIEIAMAKSELSSGEVRGTSRADGRDVISNLAITADHTVSRTDNTQILPRENRSTISEILYTEAKKHPKGIATTLAIVVAAFGLVGYGIFRLVEQARYAETFQSMRMTKLTFSGKVNGLSPALSPDGKYAAYAERAGNKHSLMLRHISTASTVPIVPFSETEFTGGATFTPDGSHIYYTAIAKNEPEALYKVAVLGGAQQKVLSDIDGSISVRGDGKQIVFVRQGRFLMLANADGTEIREIANLPNGEFWKNPCFSPDGNKIAVGYFSARDGNQMLGVVDVATGKLTRSGDHLWRVISGIAWKPASNEVFITGRDLETGNSQIWISDVSSGNARRITNDLNSYIGIGLASDAKTITTVQGNLISHIWTSSQNQTTTPIQLALGAGREEGLSGVEIAPDNSIVYTTRVAGSFEIWHVNADGTNNRKLVSEGTENFKPCVSYDGHTVVFVSNRDGKHNLWRINLDGSNPIKLTNFNELVASPDCSLLSNHVVFSVGMTDRDAIWVVDLNGGTPIELKIDNCYNPRFLPDGKSVSCRYDEKGTEENYRLAVLSVDGTSPTQFFDFPDVVSTANYRWSPDGREIIYVFSKDQVENLWAQSLDGGPPRRISYFESDDIFAFDLSRDGELFAIARGRYDSDIVMVTNFE